MTKQRTPLHEFLFWTKAALPWAILHFGVFFTILYVTKKNIAAVAVATWIVVVISGAVHYGRGKKDGLREAAEDQSGSDSTPGS